MLTILTKIDNFARPILLKFPSYLPIFIYSYGRKFFLKQFYKSIPDRKTPIPDYVRREYFGIKFQSNLFNAAGMFKEVCGYELAYRQGAGAFLVGTITPKPRIGNINKGIKHPFIPLQKSKSAINWLGLPNVGIDEALARISKIDKKSGCPIGISISLQPDSKKEQAIEEILNVFNQIEKSQVDFVELNESCPNVEHHSSADKIGSLDNYLVERLEKISNNYLRKRKRLLPVFVKFSNDTQTNQVSELVDLLLQLNFNGINFGNTSTNYHELRNFINVADVHNFDYFINNFGGGVSGDVLKNKSLELSSYAAKLIKQKNLNEDFLIIRTGGVENNVDIEQSNINGIHLNEWFTGFFEMLSKYGHQSYSKIFEVQDKTIKK